MKHKFLTVSNGEMDTGCLNWAVEDKLYVPYQYPLPLNAV